MEPKKFVIKEKRLDRDTWHGIRQKRYTEAQLTFPGFSGTAALLQIDVGDIGHWSIHGCQVPVTHTGMVWVELIPENEHIAITAMLHPLADVPEDQWGFEVVEWYVDLIDGTYRAPDGVTVFRDLFLDLIFSDGYAPVGLPPYSLIDDRDELDAAVAQGIVTPEQYEMVLSAAEAATKKYVQNTPALRQICFAALGQLLEKAKK